MNMSTTIRSVITAEWTSVVGVATIVGSPSAIADGQQEVATDAEN